MGLKAKIKNYDITIGTWITIGHPSIMEIICSADIDWVAIDMEHTAIGLQEAQNLMMAAQSFSVPCLVRVGRNDELIIKRALDCGAAGIIVPNVKCREDAQNAVASVYYPPKGKRGVGLYRAQGYGRTFSEYKNSLAENIVLVVQIEHIDAVNCINEIITVEGVDAVIIGPYDLSASMGFPGEFNRAEVQKAITAVLEQCKHSRFPAGFHVIGSEPQLTLDKITEGSRFLAYSLDFLLLGDTIRSGINKIRKEISL